MNRRRFIDLLGVTGSVACVSSMHSANASGFTRIPSRPQASSAATARTPIAIHPDNPKYFLFRGKPLVLVAATEHYGSVINRRFDFARYLEEAARVRQTVSRLFLLYRELQSPRNPYSPLKAESPDFVSPYPRRGPGNALDGEPTYNLDEWNPEYFDRLHRFLSLASSLGIVVELTLFSNTYSDRTWDLNPLRNRNHNQGLGSCEWQEYTSLKEPALVGRQIAFARKIIQETCRYDNIYYEICNEPGGDLPGHVTASEVDEWQESMGSVIRKEMESMNGRHLVVGQSAFSYTPHFSQEFDRAFSGTTLDAVTIHPLPNLVFGERTYQLGNFMSKELKLAEFRDFCLATTRSPKPGISDEDNAASLYRDDTGWTIHRKRAWMSVLCGGHYDYIDFSIQAGQEAGTSESREKIRAWMRILSDFIHSFDFIQARPVPDWIEEQPAPLVSATLANGFEDIISYFADGREIADANSGRQISGSVKYKLPEGAYWARTFSPKTGEYSPRARLSGGDRVEFVLPQFTEDIVLRVTRESAPA